MKRDLNELAEQVHEANKNWWIDLETGERKERNIGELLMLAVSELAEALEGERKDLMDDHLPHRKMAEVEMADFVIRLLDMAGGFNLDLNQSASYSTLPFENKAECLLKLTAHCLTIYEYITHHKMAEWDVYRAIRTAEFYCEKFGYDLWSAFDEKMEYNKNRKDHSLEHRKSEGGKKF